MTVLYNALICPYFNYCCVLWSNTCDTFLQPLVKIQKQAIRCICFLKRRESTIEHFRTMKIMKVIDLKYYSAAMFMFKFHKGKLPEIFSDYFTHNRDVHSYNTRQRNHFHVPVPKSKLRKQFIKCWGVTVWNNVLKSINVTVKIGSFKRQIKCSISKITNLLVHAMKIVSSYVIML